MAKIVFCEDEMVLRNVFYRHMQSMNHEIFMALNGIEGLEIIEREHPDLILTDIYMPRCNGFQLAYKIRSNPSIANIPLIFVTGHAQKYSKEEAAYYNPIGYLIKPFAAEYLHMTIDTALQHER